MKKVLVTGGTRGIGRAIALVLLKRGYRVCVTYVKDEESASQAKADGLEVYRVDVAKEKEVVDLFQTLGGVDILINNAGISLVKQLQDTSYEEYARLFAVNMGGVFLAAREGAKYMLAQNCGVIINISSVWGEVGGSCESVYSATKGAILAFTKALAKELGYSGVRVNSISPGVIDTAMNARFSKEEISALQEEIPVGRLGRAEEIASAVCFLIDNEYITGIDLPVNGGFSIC